MKVWSTARALLVAACLLAPAFAAADEPECDDHAERNVRVCDQTPRGEPGPYVTVPAGFAYVGESDAGAGSFTGARASWVGARPVITWYGNALVAFETVIVSAWASGKEPNSTIPNRVDATFVMHHRGAPNDQHASGGATATDHKEDGVPERVEAVAFAPGVQAHVRDWPAYLFVQVLGVPVVLAP